MKPKCEFFTINDFASWLDEGDANWATKKANALLTERGTVVCGGNKMLADGSFNNPFDAGPPSNQDTHTALLIDIREIEKDTAEGLLRECVDMLNCVDIGASDLLERARKLLGDK